MITLTFLSAYIEKEPGIIVKPISFLLGFVLNIIFNIVYLITTNHSLGLAIILLTIFTRLLMLPMAFKQQKSMYIMQKIQPELKKIQDKYKDKKDTASRQKMSVELNKIYAKYKYNPLSGCLPMFIQLPIFIALYYIMRNSYEFINIINNVYTEIATKIMDAPNFVEVMVPIATPMVPKTMSIDIANTSDLLKVLNKLTPENWELIKSSLLDTDISELLSQKNNIEYFMGINLTEIVGFRFPKIIIPILSGFTTFLSSWLITRKSNNTDSMIATQQKIMIIVMPLMMGYITTSLPAGVGLYWITSNIIQIIQQIFISKYYEKNVPN